MATRRPGRPPLDATDVSVKLTLALPSRKYEQLCRTAAAERQTVPELLRRTLQHIWESKIPPRDH